MHPALVVYILDIGGLIRYQYRNISASFVDEDVAGNMIQNVRVFHQFFLARVDW